MPAIAIASPRPVRIAVSNFFFVAGLCFATWASRIPDIQHHIGLDKAAFGSVLVALPVGSMVCLPLAGWLVTKLGSRTCLLIGAFIYTTILCSIGLANTTLELVLVLFFFGMAGNFMNISVNTQAVGVEYIYQRSIMASFHGLWSLGGFTGAAIGLLMMFFHLSPFYHFLIVASSIIIAVLIFFPYTLNNDNHGKEHEQFLFRWANVKAILGLGIVAFCCMGCEGCMFDWSGIYFRDVVHAPANLITVGYTTFMATMATGRFVADSMIMKLGTIKVLRLSGCLITSGLLISVFFPNFYTAAFGFFLTGFGVSSVVPLTYGLAGKSKNIAAGIAITLVSSVGFIGFVFGPPLIGYIASALSLQWSFGLMAIIGFGTVIMASKAKIA
ncbi:MFS transporter [soil metagenome]